MSTLERALAIAAEAHEGQDKRGLEPFVLHVMRVVLAVDGEEERIAAALHDVVEKSAWTLKKLRKQGFGEEVIEAVDALSRREDESREDFIARAAAHPVARRVKLADLDDNERVTRRSPPSEENRERLERYVRERRVLEAAGDGE